MQFVSENETKTDDVNTASIEADGPSETFKDEETKVIYHFSIHNPYLSKIHILHSATLLTMTLTMWTKLKYSKIDYEKNWLAEMGMGK